MVDSSRCLVYVDYLGSADHSHAETEFSFVSTTEVVSLRIQKPGKAKTGSRGTHIGL